MKKKVQLLSVGIALSKTKCGKDLHNKAQLIT